MNAMPFCRQYCFEVTLLYPMHSQVRAIKREIREMQFSAATAKQKKISTDRKKRAASREADRTIKSDSTGNKQAGLLVWLGI